MKSTDPIKNDDIVLAIITGGAGREYRFGDLKQLFVSHKLTHTVSAVEFRNRRYYVKYSATKGFSFVAMK